MRILKNLLLLITVCVFSKMSFSQERGIPTYLDYLTDNFYLVHPSMAGASTLGKIRLTARRQWFDVSNAPTLETLSANGRIGENIGLGAILFNDSNGNFSQQGAYATFAYHLPFSYDYSELNQLSFGLSAGVLQERLDETGLIGAGNASDPSISGTEQKDSYFNIDFGLSYYYYEFYAHATVKNIIPQKRDIFSKNYETDNQRSYLASVGYVIAPFNSFWSFDPSVMFMMKEVTNESTIDANIKIIRSLENTGSVWGGLSYRKNLEANNSGNYISPFLGANFGRFMLAYTYTHQLDNIVVSNTNYHQITLGYNFGEAARSGRRKGKRYRCNCPAINQ